MPWLLQPSLRYYLLQLIFRGGGRHSENVVQLGIDNIRHGVAVDVASAGRWMDKEKEPVENVLLASCLRFREEGAQSARCCLQAAVVLNNY